MNAEAPHHIAIVGSGPAGCFTAQALHRHWKDAQITIFDRLATPYGLIRYGVAADHQHTKALTRQFDRNFIAEDFRFAGNIEIGTDISLDEIRRAYPIVVLATGRWRDRSLTVPGSKLDGVLVAGDIVNALNSVPRPNLPMPEIGKRVVVVGAGNVALDMIRFLIKMEADYAGSDVSPEALNRYLREPAQEITVLSRSPIATAKADVAMVKELSKTSGIQFHVTNSSTATEDNILGRKREAAFAELAQQRVEAPRVRVHFIFGSTPSRITGSAKVEAVHLSEAPSGVESVIPTDTVISAIGFDVNAPGHWHYAEEYDFAPSNTLGRVDDGLYRAGWLKRGPVGAIPANRADAHQVAKEIIADVEADQRMCGGRFAGYDALPASVRNHAVDFAAWLKIDGVETANCPASRARQKLHTHTEMLEVAGIRGH